MKIILLVFLSLSQLFCFSQEYESDLYASLNSSTLHIFMSSEKSKMTISTLRNSKKNGIVEETKSNYKKGKINPNKINFNIHYSEFYVVEDRKKSLGKYEFNESKEFLHYERTDFDNRNQRIFGFYHYFQYENSVVWRETIRIREYIGQGSAELDSTIYKDSVIYELSDITGGLKQDNLSDPGVHTEYTVEEGRLVSKTTFFDGFHDKTAYIYDSYGHLVKITNTLTNEEKDASGATKSAVTHTDLHYSIDGLTTEAIFYDENDKMLEKKVFTYK